MTVSELLSKAEYYSLITDEEYKELKKQIQPCDDCISRKALINELKLGYFNKDLQEGKNDPCVIDAMIDWAIRTSKRLPSVTPQPKVGHWVEMELVDTGVSKFSCSVCKEGDFYNQIDNPFIPTKYCPNCGAKMEVEG